MFLSTMPSSTIRQLRPTLDRKVDGSIPSWAATESAGSARARLVSRAALVSSTLLESTFKTLQLLRRWILVRYAKWKSVCSQKAEDEGPNPSRTTVGEAEVDEASGCDPERVIAKRVRVPSLTPKEVYFTRLVDLVLKTSGTASNRLGFDTSYFRDGNQDLANLRPLYGWPTERAGCSA